MVRQFVGPTIRKADANWRCQMGDARKECIASSSATRTIIALSLADLTDYRAVESTKQHS